MNFKTGNLFDPDLPDPPDVRIFSANGVLNKKGELVMGAGAALAAKRFDPQSPALLGRMLRDGGFQYSTEHESYAYGLLILRRRGLGAFQTKYHYRGKAHPELISLGAKKLSEFMLANPNLRVAMNYPGIGLGGLSADLVKELLDEYLHGLPLDVWSLPRKTPHDPRGTVYRIRTKRGRS